MGETKRVQPLEGLLNFIGALPDAMAGKGRVDVFRDELSDGITVDTCCPVDTDRWETGIERLKLEGKWVIVEQYDSQEDAKIGHQKWVALMKLDSSAKLEDINLWNLPQ